MRKSVSAKPPVIPQSEHFEKAKDTPAARKHLEQKGKLEDAKLEAGLLKALHDAKALSTQKYTIEAVKKAPQNAVASTRVKPAKHVKTNQKNIHVKQPVGGNRHGHE